MAAPSSPPSPGRPVSALPGCYILLIGLLLLVGTVIWAGYTFIRQAGELNAFTDPDPAPLSIVVPAAADVDALRARLDRFAHAAGAGPPPAELRLTADDLNTMLAGFPRLADLQSIIRVREIRPEATFTAEIRFPMNSLPGKRRYLNGEMDGRFGVHPEAGLFVSALDVRVPGRTVPPGFIDVYQRGIVPGKNFGFLDDMLLRNFREDPAFAPTLTRIASVRSEGPTLILSTAKDQTNPSAHDAHPSPPLPGG